MNVPLKDVHIHHFRSIRDCSLTDLRQINVLIGRPNTGKTNIIDAVTLFAIPELTNRTDLKLKHVIRAHTPEELFLIKNQTQYARVTSNRVGCALQYSQVTGLNAQLTFDNAHGEHVYNFDAAFRALASSNTFIDPVIKRYRYFNHIAFTRIGGTELTVPYGQNLFGLLDESPEIQKLIAEIIDSTGITMHFDAHGPKIRITNDPRPNTELHFPSLSASLQRLCFYLAAIKSNREKFIVFDNPDANIFPTMLVHLATGMLENVSNQYLFSTHEYYILIDLLEDELEKVAIFNVYTENGETKIYRLTDEDLKAILYNGVDPFINNEAFIPKKSSAI